MDFEDRESWMKRVGEVFAINPSGEDKIPVAYVQRLEEEAMVRDYLLSQNTNFCVEGPSGVGKTVLVNAMLKETKTPFARVKLTTRTTWTKFCELVLKARVRNRIQMKREYKFGFDRGAPTFLVNLVCEKDVRDAELEREVEARAKIWSEHEIVSALEKWNLALFIDDFESADPDITERIANAGRLFTGDATAPHSRLIVVGTDHILRRLVEKNRTVPDRFFQVHIGGLASPSRSLEYLELGFAQIPITHPGSRPGGERPRTLVRRLCGKAVFDAANGTFKSLVKLGYQICRGQDAHVKRIVSQDLIRIAEKLTEETYKTFKPKHTEVFRVINGNAVADAIFRHLYAEGINAVHRWDVIENHFSEHFSQDQIQNALGELITQAKFLVRVGFNGEVIFPADPVQAHNLGVVFDSPSKFNLPKDFFTPTGQLPLPFLRKVDWNSEICEEKDQGDDTPSVI